MKYMLAFLTIFLFSTFSFEAAADCRNSQNGCPGNCSLRQVCKIQGKECSGGKRKPTYTFECNSKKQWCLVGGSSFCSARQQNTFKKDKVE